MPQNLAEEQLGALVLWVIEEGVWLILFDDFSLIHKDHPVGYSLGEPHLMGYAEHGHAFIS